MPQLIAFLRAINVGGHIVKMDVLRQHFEALGLKGVSTFIASGNVIFDAPADLASPPDSSPTPLRTLELQIEAHLKQMLGYDVATFIRTAEEVVAVTRHKPFSDEDLANPDHYLYVSFTAAPLSDAAHQKLMALQTEADEFHAHGREVYWLCRKKISDSKITGKMLEKAIGMAATARNITTVQKLAEKFGGR